MKEKNNLQNNLQQSKTEINLQNNLQQDKTEKNLQKEMQQSKTEINLQKEMQQDKTEKNLQKEMQQSSLQLSETELAMLAEEEKKYGAKLEEMAKDREYNMCFACGDANPVGLHLHFFWIPDGVLAFFTPKPEHQSYNGRMHGGLITVLLDEIMGNYLFKKEGVPAYTARIDLRFRTPVQIGETIRCEGHEVRRKGRLVIMKGIITNPDGSVAAEATSTLMLEKE